MLPDRVPLTAVASKNYRISVPKRRSIPVLNAEKLLRFAGIVVALATASTFSGACASGDALAVWTGGSTSVAAQESHSSDQEGAATAGSSTSPGIPTPGDETTPSGGPVPDSTPTSDSGQGDGTSDSESTSSDSLPDLPDKEPLPAGEGYACGVQIYRVSINQSLELDIADAGDELPIAGYREMVFSRRRSLVRVYLYKRSAQPKNLKVTLEIQGHGVDWDQDQELLLTKSSSVEDPDSTANFLVPDTMLAPNNKYRVLVKQDSPCTPGPRDHSRLPRHGMWSLGSRLEPRLDLQFVQVRSPGEARIEGLKPEFKRKLRAALRARYPFGEIRFNLWGTLSATATSASTDPSKRAQLLLQAVKRVRKRLEKPGSKSHYLGIARLGELGAGLGDAPKTDVPGVALVNLDPSGVKNIERMVAMIGRMHGLDERSCKATGPSGLIDAWGFDSRRDHMLDPKDHYDISCGMRPDWIHRPSYAQVVRRAMAIWSR